jgi:hypothetical protein
MEKNECPASSLLLLGQPLIVRNVRITIGELEIKTIMIPERFRLAIKLIQDNFPMLDIQEYNDEDTKGYNYADQRATTEYCDSSRYSCWKEALK